MYEWEVFRDTVILNFNCLQLWRGSMHNTRRFLFKFSWNWIINIVPELKHSFIKNCDYNTRKTNSNNHFIIKNCFYLLHIFCDHQRFVELARILKKTRLLVCTFLILGNIYQLFLRIWLFPWILGPKASIPI